MRIYLLYLWEATDCNTERDFVCECPLIECKYALSYFTYLLSKGTCVNTVSCRENFTFANNVNRHICDHLKFASRAWFTISVNDRVRVLFTLRGFYFHQTSHMRGFTKIKSSGKFPSSAKIKPSRKFTVV